MPSHLFGELESIWRCSGLRCLLSALYKIKQLFFHVTGLRGRDWFIALSFVVPD